MIIIKYAILLILCTLCAESCERSKEQPHYSRAVIYTMSDPLWDAPAINLTLALERVVQSPREWMDRYKVITDKDSLNYIQSRISKAKMQHIGHYDYSTPHPNVVMYLYGTDGKTDTLAINYSVFANPIWYNSSIFYDSGLAALITENECRQNTNWKGELIDLFTLKNDFNTLYTNRYTLIKRIWKSTFTPNKYNKYKAMLKAKREYYSSLYFDFYPYDCDGM